MKYVLYGILVYIAYKFIFKLVIPVFIASRKFKKGFREMSEKMNQANNNTKQQSRPSPPKEHSGEYIDFEELK